MSPVRESGELTRFDQTGNEDAGGNRSLQTCGELPGVKDTSSEINLARGWQPDCDSVEQHSSVQDPGAHALSKQKRTRDQQECLRRCQ